VYKAVTVTCPSGLMVVGGGYSLVGALGSVVLDDFIPSTFSLTVGAGEVVGPGEPSDGTTASWRVVAEVACASPLPGQEIVSQTTQYGGFTPEGDAWAPCPAGKQVVGGGESLSNGWGQISTDNLYLDSSGVYAHAVEDEDGYSGNWSITAYAICAIGVPVTHHSGNFGSYNSNSPKDTAAGCGTGERVLSAGWALYSTNSSTGSEQVINSRAELADTSVAVTAAEDASGYSGTWNVYASAVCAPM
jgi:hypothetical protein